MFEVIISENFSKVMTHTKSQIKEAQGTSSRRYTYTQANHTQTVVNRRQSLEKIHREKFEEQCNVEYYKQMKLYFKS